MNAAALVYFGGVTLLFFFWVYGIWAFARDLRGRYVPAVRQYVRGRQREKEKTRRERERDEREQQLY